MKTGRALLGVLAGFAAGAALGVLFAPEKGSTTRNNILKKGGELANSVNDSVDKNVDKLAEAIMGRFENQSKRTVNGPMKEQGIKV